MILYNMSKAKNNTLVREYISPNGTIKHVRSNATKSTMKKYDKKTKKLEIFKLKNK